MGVKNHFQQYFSYTVEVIFIGVPGENHQPVIHYSPTNFIT